MINSVLIVLKHFNYGGTERYAVNLANELSNSGITVVMVGGKGPLAAHINPDIKVIFAPIGRKKGKKTSEKIILAAAKKYRPQIIHAQCRNSLICCQLARRSLKIPTISHEHLAYSKKEYLFVANELKDYSDMAITVKELVASELVSAGLRENNVKTIYNGINLDDFPFTTKAEKIKSRKLLNLTKSDKVILCLSRVVPGKGIEELIDAFAIVSAKIPNAKLVIAGDDEWGETKQKIMQMIISHKLSGKALLYPAQFNIRKLHLIADVFCYPPINRGMAVMEAMASCLPIVAKKAPEKPFVAENNISGLLVKSDNPTELAEKLIILLEKPDFALKLGKQGRIKIEKEYNLKRIVNEILNAYDDTIIYHKKRNKDQDYSMNVENYITNLNYSYDQLED